MRRALIFIVIILVLVGSGFLTTQFVSRDPNAPLPGMRVQTSNPAASVMVTTPEKGTLFLLFAGFVIFNVVGIGATLAIIFWFLNKQVNRAKVRPNREFSFALTDARPNSLGGVLARRPAITISALIILVLGAALTLALLGVFTPR